MVKKFAWYPADDEKKPMERRVKKVKNPTKLRKSIEPGCICILLSGRFRGRRVIVLKQLVSGLLLVTGPYKINGVPLRRINQTYVMPTSTKINLNNVDLANIDDAFFAKKKAAKGNKDEKFFAEEKAVKKEISGERKSAQKKVDEGIMKNFTDDMMKKYLKTRFTLRNGMRPHLMKFQ